MYLAADFRGTADYIEAVDISVRFNVVSRFICFSLSNEMPDFLKLPVLFFIG